MDKMLEKFLKEIKIKETDYPLFDGGKLSKMSYIKNKDKYVATISFDRPIDFKVYNLLNEYIKNFKFKCEFLINISDKETFTQEKLNEYWEYIFEREFSTVGLMKEIKPLLYYGEIAFSVFTVLQENMLKNYAPTIREYLNMVGLDFNIKIVVADNKKLMEDMKKETIKEKEKIIENARKVSESYSSYSEHEPSSQYRRFTPKGEQEEVTIKELNDTKKNVKFSGKVFFLEEKETSTKRLIVYYYVTDFESSIIVKCFEGKTFDKETLHSIKEGDWIEVTGSCDYDQYEKDTNVSARSIEKIESKDIERLDTCTEKRVELHLHSKMSTMDGVSDIKEYVSQAIKWGHKAIAITDHNVVQGYPDAVKAISGKDIKMLWGSEVTITNNKPLYIYKASDVDLSTATYVVFDTETTGVSSELDHIIEIGAVKMSDGIVRDRFQTFIDVEQPLSAFTTELTGITDEMLKGQPKAEEALRAFLDFVGDAVLVCHNATFDIGMIKSKIYKYGWKLDNPVIDTLNIARRILPGMKNYRLGTLCKKFGVVYDTEDAHRADYDAEVTAACWDGMLSMLEKNFDIQKHNEINKLVDGEEYKRKFAHHATILARNEAGIKSLYRLISKAHVETFASGPKTLKEDIEKEREHLLIGSACCNGEVFEIAQTKSFDELKETIQFYDYVEVQPLEQYYFLLDTGRVESKDRLREIIENIVRAAKECNKIVVATGDCHYCNPNQKEFRTIYIDSKVSGGGRHPLYDLKGRIKEYPNQHFRSTDEMLECFEFLGKELAYEIVVTNTNKVADMCEVVKPLKDGTYHPKLEGSDEKLVELCYKTAKERYGDPLPEIVLKRVEKEINSIIGNGYGVLYYIAHKLVKKSNDDGYVVGSRGSVGSSLVATFTGITEVNPLPPHYVCPKCQHSEFFTDGSVASGFDLPEKDCPHCNTKMIADGHDIPFETFLGFKGDKVPDIDLNFSGDYQWQAHNYTKVLFGEDNVFRAGTIGTVADKTAEGYVKGFFENKNLPYPSKAEIKRLAIGCSGVKRTTGQHPGGIVVVPQYMDVYDFTPVNYPADDIEATWRTTHFDFHAIHDNILKLDILGHVDPTVLRMLGDVTGIDPKTVKVNDEKVLALFDGPEVMGITKEQARSETGTSGVPEFNTPFTKKMLLATKPRSFSDLVQISGLSHGTNVWSDNAEKLIAEGTCTIKTVIGCRDDIMTYLMYKNLEPIDAFKIMESVRKGRGLTPENIQNMQEHNVPSWYIESCQKIKYMFPKAHAVAYVMMALRSAWYKIYKPLHYYAVYFSTRCNIFDIGTMMKGYDAILVRYVEIMNRKRTKQPVSNTEEEILTTLENALEMTARGYKFGKLDINISEASRFLIDEEKKEIIPPFITIDGLGLNVAKSIVEARNERSFISIEDVLARTQINNTQRDKLIELGAFGNLNEENQLSLF